MKLTPLYDRVLVKQFDAESKSKGGIIFPDNAKEKPKQGIVIALGSGKVDGSGERIVMTVKEDDIVLFSAYSGTQIKVDEADYLIMREEDILGVFE